VFPLVVLPKIAPAAPDGELNRQSLVNFSSSLILPSFFMVERGGILPSFGRFAHHAILPCPRYGVFVRRQVLFHFTVYSADLPLVFPAFSVTIQTW